MVLIQKLGAASPRLSRGHPAEAHPVAPALHSDTEARLRAVYDHAPVGICEIDPSTSRILHVNEAYCRLTGYHATELLGGLAIGDLAHPGDLADDLELHRKLMAGEIESYRIERRFLREDGSTAWAEIAVSTARDAGGSPIREIRIVQDITERKHAEAALRESEARLRALFETVPVGLVTLDPQTLRITAANRRAAEQLGYTPEEFTRLHLDDVHHGRTRDELLERGRAVAADPPGTRYELSVSQRCKDGEVREVLVHNVRVELDRRPAVYGAWIDVTDQNSAMEAVRRSEERYRMALDAGQIATFEVDIPAAVYSWDARMRALWDVGEATVTPELIAARIHPEDRARVLQAMESSRSSGLTIPREMEYRIVRLDGTERRVSNRWKVEFGADGPLRSIGTVIDVTVQRRGAEAIEQSEKRLRLALQAGRIGTFDLDTASNEVRWNERMYEIYGFEPGSPITRERIVEAIHPEDRERIASLSAKSRDGSVTSVEGLEFRILNSAGEVVRHALASWHVERAQGCPARIIGTTVDVTEQRHAAMVLARDKKDLEHLVEERTAALMQLAQEREALQDRLRQTERLDALGQLTGGVAHDFNNLLTAVIGGAEEILDSTDPDSSLREPAQTILTAGERGAELTKQLLAFARQQPLAPRDVVVAEMLDQMLGLLRRAAGELITFEMRTGRAAHAAITRVDPLQLETAVLNLVVNARDAMPDGGRIRIGVDLVRLDTRPDLAGGEYVVVSVVDTGQGMSHDVLARACEPFFTTKDIGRGTGLGLSMVYGFASQSGGSVEIDSEPGEGTKVRLLLPAVARAPEPSEPVKSAEPRGSGEHVLLVEDDPLVRAQVEARLRSLHYEVTSAGDARSALALLEQRLWAFDLLMTDVAMPGGMSGYELAAEVAQRRPGFPILLTTGHGGAGRIKVDEDAVTWPTIRKPYRRSLLARALRDALSPDGTPR
ncbi:PAS domain S-box protein [Roseomonas sp. CCTCC AB2023176]|uniref:PAS domain-containing hybrid sensor histidine kinase/response regulator n=1 Tax=Roseomonas sp. CCTCC AB2023176 TaxID=3342640 RepID=UPI0035DC7DC8